MRCSRSFSRSNSSGVIPRNVCLARLSICSRISRSSSALSCSTLARSINHAVIEGRSLAGGLMPPSFLQRTAELAHRSYSARAMAGANHLLKQRREPAANVQIQNKTRTCNRGRGAHDPAIFQCKLVGARARNNTAKTVLALGLWRLRTAWRRQPLPRKRKPNARQALFPLGLLPRRVGEEKACLHLEETLAAAR